MVRAFSWVADPYFMWFSPMFRCFLDLSGFVSVVLSGALVLHGFGVAQGLHKEADHRP